MNKIKTKLGRSLTAVFILLLAVSVLSYWCIATLRASREQRNDHSRALLLLERTLSEVRSAEAIQREHIIFHKKIDINDLKMRQKNVLFFLNEYRSHLDAALYPAADSIFDLVNARYEIIVQTAIAHNENDPAQFTSSFNAGVKKMQELQAALKVQEANADSSSLLMEKRSDALSYFTDAIIILAIAVTFILVYFAYRNTNKALKIKEQAESRLRESEHMRKLITDIVPGLIAVYNIRTGQYLYVNNAIQTILGYEKEIVLEHGLNFLLTILHPDDMPVIMQQNQEALLRANTDPSWNDLEPVNFEYRLRHKDGRWKWFFTSGLVFKRGSDGLVEELINLSFDITENKQYESDLELSEAKFRTLFEKSRDAVMLLHEGRFTDCNSATLDLFNASSKSQIIGRTRADLSPVKQPCGLSSEEKINALVGEILDKGWHRFEWVHRKFTGENFWVEVSVTPLTIDGKTVLHTAVRDITERKQAEEQLSKSEEMLLEAHKLANLGSWEWDIASGRITWTDELFRMYGYEPGAIEISYGTFLTCLHEEDRDFVNKTIEAALGTQQPFSFEHRIVQPSGTVRTLLAKGRVIADGEGKTVRMRGSTLDISDIKNTREELRLKEEFIGIASHELKTPLTSVKAYVQLLEEMMENADDTTLAYLRKTSAHVDRLNRLISDLLDVSKIQAGKLQFNISEFSIDELVKESIESIQYTSATHRIMMQGESNTIVKGDKLRLEQAFVNFLTNAIKYSPRADKVVVNLANTGDAVKISVTDFGIGIPSEKVPKIFDRFYRVENTPHKFTGLGIGLYIASEIIQRHNGSIWVESREGEGSTFHFTLPLN